MRLRNFTGGQNFGRTDAEFVPTLRVNASTVAKEACIR